MTLDEIEFCPKQTYIIEEDYKPDEVDVNDLGVWDKVIINGRDSYVHTCYECKNKFLKPTMTFVPVRCPECIPRSSKF